MEVRSHVAGILVEYLAQVGDLVAEGQDVVSLESMKMEILVQTPVSGVVREVICQPGDFVNEGDLLMILE